MEQISKGVQAAKQQANCPGRFYRLDELIDWMGTVIKHDDGKIQPFHQATENQGADEKGTYKDGDSVMVK